MSPGRRIIQYCPGDRIICADGSTWMLRYTLDSEEPQWFPWELPPIPEFGMISRLDAWSAKRRREDALAAADKEAQRVRLRAWAEEQTK